MTRDQDHNERMKNMIEQYYDERHHPGRRQQDRGGPRRRKEDRADEQRATESSASVNIDVGRILRVDRLIIVGDTVTEEVLARAIRSADLDDDDPEQDR